AIAARRLGAHPVTVMVTLALCLFMIEPSREVRTQELALPLFVALAYLLATDSRAPSRRAYVCLPLLVLWANIRGTVTRGVALAGVAVWSVGRWPWRTTPWERLALLALAAGSIAVNRNALFFGLFTLMLLPVSIGSLRDPLAPARGQSRVSAPHRGVINLLLS